MINHEVRPTRLGEPGEGQLAWKIAGSPRTTSPSTRMSGHGHQPHHRQRVRRRRLRAPRCPTPPAAGGATMHRALRLRPAADGTISGGPPGPTASRSASSTSAHGEGTARGRQHPAILAVAQHKGIGGKDLVRIATGYEIQVDLVKDICCTSTDRPSPWARPQPPASARSAPAHGVIYGRQQALRHDRDRSRGGSPPGSARPRVRQMAVGCGPRDARERAVAIYEAGRRHRVDLSVPARTPSAPAASGRSARSGHLPRALTGTGAGPHRLAAPGKQIGASRRSRG